MRTLTAQLIAIATVIASAPLLAQTADPVPRSFRVVRADPKLDELVSSDAQAAVRR